MIIICDSHLAHLPPILKMSKFFEFLFNNQHVRKDFKERLQSTKKMKKLILLDLSESNFEKQIENL
ncbi:hypothetical protein Bhyg_10458 [Pseudolycoriella hygida]|uniref:Uncharacterized protein n=1 Tax=Pseudolycoriella hygida TaxID=35572 RepID=A0A9Q0RYR7_9DIPT|nr:hypothetical protein Bhyg_10458 [Pseudolycoriella hygida]